MSQFLEDQHDVSKCRTVERGLQREEYVQRHKRVIRMDKLEI